MFSGQKVQVEKPDPSHTLLQFLRNDLGLYGTKLGCGEGGCGACTVMVSHMQNEKIHHNSVNACLAPLCGMHGTAITTVEGIGSTRTKLHAVQQKLADAHGSQCGFCTPGIVMSMYTLLRNNPSPKMEDIETYFQVQYIKMFKKHKFWKIIILEFVLGKSLQMYWIQAHYRRIQCFCL